MRATILHRCELDHKMCRGLVRIEQCAFDSRCDAFSGGCGPNRPSMIRSIWAFWQAPRLRDEDREVGDIIGRGFFKKKSDRGFWVRERSRTAGRVIGPDGGRHCNATAPRFLQGGPTEV